MGILDRSTLLDGELTEVFVSRDVVTHIEDEETFVARWQERRNESMARIAIRLGVAFHGISLITDQLLITRVNFLILVTSIHLIYLAFIAGWAFLAKRRSLRARHLIIPLQFFTLASYYVFLYDELGNYPEVNNIAVLKTWTAFVCVSLYMIPITPYSSRVTVLLAGLYWALAWYAWQQSTYGYVILFIYAIALVGALSFHFAMYNRTRGEAKRELRARSLLAQAERSRLDRELELARQIQESMAPPPSLSLGGMVARCYQKKHSMVGGDWVAMRRGHQGNLIVVVADATGKGIQAALVIHAIQSLWAEALNANWFSPEKWLRKVNATLLRLGATQTHSVTMGIVEVYEGRLVYWSAGHVPLYVIRGEGERSSVRAVSGRGSPLGLFEDIRLEPSTHRFDTHTDMTFLLGTDGVFDKGTLAKREQIIWLRDRIRKDGAQAIEQVLVEDDKTLVCIDQDQPKNRVAMGTAR